MLRALATYATDPSTIRGQNSSRPAGGVEQAYQRLRELANQGMGPESAGVLRDMHFTAWDYKAAAYVLLGHLVPRREAMEDQELQALLDSPPDPGSDGGVDGGRKLAKRALEQVEGKSARSRRIKADLEKLNRLTDRREDAVALLRERLRDAAMTSPHLMAAALWREMSGGKRLPEELRDALLDLGRSDAFLVQMMEQMDFPVPEEISLLGERGGAERGLFKKMSASSLGQKLSKEVPGGPGIQVQVGNRRGRP
jgi:hypothetical protein